MSSIADLLFQSCPNNIYKSIGCFNTEIPQRKLGGRKVKVQIDETVVAHGKLSNCPSATPNDFPSIVCLVGMIEEGLSDFSYFIVPNRTQEIITALFKQHIEEENLIITNKFVSYPGAVRNNNCKPQIVNHSKGLKKHRSIPHQKHRKSLVNSKIQNGKKMRNTKKRDCEFFGGIQMYESCDRTSLTL
ncbi:hypothetical protein NGRA_0552 [Nosema granulosis]|uniref:ISXO2-like transposase domain-containing protein n=1 Tax=Nosema granulosis TaxID=83296 RepID=A0A9P6H1R9_9MICR|nr:hypothetical protein NGRA_0552 [Nosema granulosis]